MARGPGATITVSTSYSSGQTGQQILFLGYAGSSANPGINLSGGNANNVAGATVGGLSGNLTLTNTVSQDSSHTAALGPGGGVGIFGTFVALNGGNAQLSLAAAGNGGQLTLKTQQTVFFGSKLEQAINAGTVTLNGGTGTNSGTASTYAYGGSQGWFSIIGLDMAENTGSITGTGGEGAIGGGGLTGGGTTANFGAAPSMMGSYLGPATNSGTIAFTGGQGDVGSGGNVGSVSIGGLPATNAGGATITITGGKGKSITGTAVNGLAGGSVWSLTAIGDTTSFWATKPPGVYNGTTYDPNLPGASGGVSLKTPSFTGLASINSGHIQAIGGSYNGATMVNPPNGLNGQLSVDGETIDILGGSCSGGGSSVVSCSGDSTNLPPTVAP